MSSKNYYTFELTVTQKCDMACTYCFEGDELKNTKKAPTVEEVIPKIRELLDSSEFMSHYNGISLQAWGGEPSLATNYIISLFKEFRNDPVDFFMYTNGYNINNLSKIINNLLFNDLTLDRFSMQISYDGISHDKERVDHNGDGTATKVLENIKKLKTTYPDLNLQLKATLPIDQLTNLEQHWYHWKEIVDEFPSFSWSPTLEYTNKYEITPIHLALITEQFTKLAKLELQYFQEHQRFVFAWFGSQDANVCSAGANIGNIDLDGNISVCHGALYSPNKEHFQVGNIYTSSFVESILKMRTRHMQILEVPESCRGCEATVCYQCPIVQYDNSTKDTYEEKYHDPKSDLCSVYKSFGKIDRTIQRHLNIRK
jgi:radical SAM protein with 4Fe4S-binding SPASM domain